MSDEHAPDGAGEPAMRDARLETARESMRRTIRALGIASLVVLAIFITGLVVEAATEDMSGPYGIPSISDELFEPGGAIVALGSPVLAVIALNIHVWRTNLDRLASFGPALRVAAVLPIGIGLAILSVVLLYAILFVGAIGIMLIAEIG